MSERRKGLRRTATIKVALTHFARKLNNKTQSLCHLECVGTIPHQHKLVWATYHNAEIVRLPLQVLQLDQNVAAAFCGARPTTNGALADPLADPPLTLVATEGLAAATSRGDTGC